MLGYALLSDGGEQRTLCSKSHTTHARVAERSSGPLARCWLAARCRNLVSRSGLPGGPHCVCPWPSALEYQPAESIRLAPSALASQRRVPTLPPQRLQSCTIRSSLRCVSWPSQTCFVDSCSRLLSQPSWRKEHNARCQVRISLLCSNSIESIDHSSNCAQPRTEGCRLLYLRALAAAYESASYLQSSFCAYGNHRGVDAAVV